MAWIPLFLVLQSSGGVGMGACMYNFPRGLCSLTFYGQSGQCGPKAADGRFKGSQGLPLQYRLYTCIFTFCFAVCLRLYQRAASGLFHLGRPLKTLRIMKFIWRSPVGLVIFPTLIIPCDLYKLREIQKHRLSPINQAGHDDPGSTSGSGSQPMSPIWRFCHAFYNLTIYYSVYCVMWWS